MNTPPAQIWFNPSCSKCRAAQELFEESGTPYILKRYLDDVPTPEQLEAALNALRLEPWDVTRMNEPEAKELGLAEMSRERAAWIDVLVKHPRLIQRPIIVTADGQAWVARDAETLQAAVGAAQTVGSQETLPTSNA